jgi:hypothetical protein
MIDVQLNDTEQATLDKWAASRKVKKLLRGGGTLILSYDWGSGIGRSVSAIVANKSAPIDSMIESKDITDYSTW